MVFPNAATPVERQPVNRNQPVTNYGRNTFPSNPNELDDHHMTLTVIRYRYRNRSNDVRQKDLLGSIVLPLPPNLATSYQSRYNNEALGVAGHAGARGGEAFRQGFDRNGVSGGITALKDRIAAVEKSELQRGLLSLGVEFLESEVGPLVTSLVGGLGAGVATIGAQRAFTGALAGAGIARNPHEAILFQGVEFRDHRFNWKLVPRNRQDSDAIREIIYVLKHALLPSYAGGNHFFEYPHMFEIDFSRSLRDYLFDIGPSFLVSMNVDYHGEGISQYVDHDGVNRAPVSVLLSLQFAEATITTREDISRGGGGR